MDQFNIFEILVIGILGLVHFLPTFIAFRRKHQSKVAILMLNLLLGWTLLGWVGALVWSLTAVTPPVVSKPS